MSTITTIPAREFARNLAGAKRAAQDGPVLITDRGEPTYALLRIEDYYRLTGRQAATRSLLVAMEALPGTEGIDFEAPRQAGTARVIDLD
jgi:prevent-host-death family protein